MKTLGIVSESRELNRRTKPWKGGRFDGTGASEYRVGWSDRHQSRNKSDFCFRGPLWQNPTVGITRQQFEQMQGRLTGARRVAAPVLAPSCTPAANGKAVIIGVDPSLRGTGYGVIRPSKPYPVTLAQGTIRCPAAWERSRCLVKILEVLREVVKAHHPTICVIEALFYAQNLQTALIMGEARGACLVAVAESGLDIYEIAPRKVKQSIVGYGAAQKLAVAKMVQRMLRLDEPPEPDAADALALALAHFQEAGRMNLGLKKRI
jgi:crossover junction endodeoxyribonuclease RuvC